jgi:lipoate-protein ligase A
MLQLYNEQPPVTNVQHETINQREGMDAYPLATWRLLRSAPASGAMNMATDEAILHAVAAGQTRPTLRFYAWRPPCLSLGRGQKSSDVDLEALDPAGYDLVRRPTGGKAILHIDELTYSVVAPETDPRMAGGVVTSYRRLSAGLVRGLRKLGALDAMATGRRQEPAGEERRQTGPVCFEVPSDYEITAHGRKLIGSAQMRAEGVVLQHGTIPLYGDVARICLCLISRPDRVSVRARATTVEKALGKAVTWDEAAEAMAEGFAEALNLRLEPGTLSEEEVSQAEKLRDEKYATSAWTHKLRKGA